MERQDSARYRWTNVLTIHLLLSVLGRGRLDSTRSYNPFLGQKSFSVLEHYCASSRDNFEEVVYPEGDQDAVSISKRDVDLLQPNTFINDTIIDFYIMYLKNKMNPEGKDRFHFFNSFFFRKLADLDKDPSRACEGRAAFQRVRRWTAKVDIFGKDFIFIPVNFSLHWSLIVICFPGEVATFREEGMEKSSRVPCILHMNSIRGSHKGLKNLIQSYLMEEWKERHMEVTEDVARRFLNMLFVCLKLPQQDNSFDCGLFLLHYVELFLEQAPFNFDPSEITISSKFLTEDWFSTEDVACKRECIKRLICEITKDRVQKVSTADYDDSYTLHCLEEENTCMNLIQEACNAREEACHARDEHLTVSPVANLIRGLKSAAVSEVVSRDLSLTPDSAKPLTNDNYRHYGQKAAVNLFRNVMSPIEEEEIGEQMSVSPAPYASSNSKAETLFLGRFSLSPDSEKITPGSGSNGPGSPNSLEIQDEEDFRPEVEVSGPDGAKYDSPISTEEFAGYIVLDSQEEDDENHASSGLANNLSSTALCHKEFDSNNICDNKVNEKILSSQLVEQAAKKPRRVPEVLELSSSGKGKEQTVSSSTSCEEVISCFVHDSEEVNSNICVEANNFKAATASGNKHVAVKMRHLFRHPRKVRVDLSEDLHVQL